MYQYDDSTVVATLPTPAALGTAGYFTDGNPATNSPATILRSDFMNMLMMELLNLVEAGGLTPSKTTYNQVLASIKNIVESYAVDTGAANAYVGSYPFVSAIYDGLRLRFRATHANTGASTFNAAGTGAVSIYSQQHTNLTGGEIVANGDVEVVWNSTLNSGAGAWVLLESTGGAQQLPSGSYGVTPATNNSSTLVATTAFANPGASVGTSGYVKLPSGLIIQWGPGNFSTSGTANTYPIAFPNHVVGVFLGFTANTFVWLSSYNGLTGFTLTSGGSGGYPYFAIGY